MPELALKALMRNFAVACIGGEIVGYCQFSNGVPRFGLECGFIGQLYVHPDHCGKGIGTRLFTAVRSAFRLRGRGNVVLTCLAKNRRTRTFYERHGGIEFLGELFGPVGSVIPIVYYGFGPGIESQWAEITGEADKPIAERHLL